MTADDRLEMICAKVLRAREHTVALIEELNIFYATNPYEYQVRETGDGRRTYYISRMEPFPDRISVILGDVFQNLRSALDHLAWQIVEAAGNQPTQRTAFPITDREINYSAIKDFEKGNGRLVAGWNPKALKILDNIKPFKGGNQMLWQLHKLNNIDKHRKLFTAFADFDSINMGAVITGMFNSSFPDQKIENVLNAYFRPKDTTPLNMGDIFFTEPATNNIIATDLIIFRAAIAESEVEAILKIDEILPAMGILVHQTILDFKPFLS